MDIQPLTGGRTTQGVVQIGDTVRRPIVRDATFGHQCLEHLERVGFLQAPRFLGIDEAGREILSFIPGSVPVDLGHYSDVQIGMAAALLRRFHDATATMHHVKASGFEVACHNDWSPTNTVFRADEPVAMIDFDTVQPGERLWDAGYSAFTWLDLGNDDLSAEEQIRRLGIFADAYAWPDCTVPRLATYAVARQTTLAASTRLHGKLDIADWASSCASWTALNIIGRVSSTGYYNEKERQLCLPTAQ